MAELAPRARLQPSLLDRIIDNEPGAIQESRERRILSMSQLKAAVLSDLVWLLNSACQQETELSGLKEVERSVLNFGVPSLTGRSAAGMQPIELERMLTLAITRYEPRILPRTLLVTVVTEAQHRKPNTLVIEIQGDLWAQPLPEALYIRTAVDLETGYFSVEER
jgi:type VI secretion system protein ImpF